MYSVKWMIILLCWHEVVMDRSYVDKSRLSALSFMDQSEVCVTICPIDAPCGQQLVIFEDKLWYKLEFLRGTTVQITANGTDLVFLLFAALISTILSGFNVVGHGPLASFVVCPRSVLMIKRSPVLLVQSILFFAFYFILLLFLHVPQ